MTTFRQLVGNFYKSKEAEQNSSLDMWFESVLDVPIDSLALKDLCRAIRQKVYVNQLIPRALSVLTEDPLAGEYYDGELVAALSTLDNDDLASSKEAFIKIKNIIDSIDVTELNEKMRIDITKIKLMIP
ncbi:contact-dependent growth inhibition system immunity protein [Dickeya zeae]|uniref:contact-dependent growth inhibition system immunity protein n=2 Tax=Dickeya zeae TaxID=204042 RepID=UPI0003C7ED8D|nr:contact-dependent growth inhibition system immunity protein [Dickeya zeae]